MYKLMTLTIAAAVTLMPAADAPRPAYSSFAGIAAADAGEPEYAKWSRIAFEEVKRKYSNAELVDYRHIGLKEIAPGIAEETFKFWLNGNGRGFGVVVRIRFDPAKGKLISVVTEDVDAFKEDGFDRP